MSFLACCVAALSLAGRQSGDRATLEASVDAYVAPLIDLQVFSGTILVARRDTILAERSYGLADVEHGIPITPQTVFRIASLSKSFTNALIGHMIDRGQLTLDDPVSRWIPSIPSADKMTIRMLLDHRAGVPSVNSISYDENGIGPHSLAELVDSIATMKLDFEPGARQRYSNGGYAVLARIVEKIEGQPFANVLEREIIVPLGLSHTKHEADGEIIANLADGYMPSCKLPASWCARHRST